MHNVHEIPLIERFRPEGLEEREREVIAGALNLYGVENPYRADTKNLTAFTWEQVLQALQRGRQHSTGDALDDLDDVIFAVRDERKTYLN